MPLAAARCACTATTPAHCVTSMAARERKREQGSAATLDELIAIGRRRNMKNPAGWARHVMAARSLRSGKARVREVVA